MDDFNYIMVVVCGIIAGIGTAFIAYALATAYLDDDEEDYDE